jgi:CheY-like chemotaxis protein
MRELPAIDPSSVLVGRPAGRGVGRRVAIVEDNPTVRHVFTIALVEEGFSVALWSPGEPVLDFLRRCAPDAVLLDLHLGVAEAGETILIALRADHAFDQTAILVVTGDLPAAARLAREARTLGIVVVPKPVGTTALREAVAGAIAQHPVEAFFPRR